MIVVRNPGVRERQPALQVLKNDALLANLMRMRVGVEVPDDNMQDSVNHGLGESIDKRAMPAKV